MNSSDQEPDMLLSCIMTVISMGNLLSADSKIMEKNVGGIDRTGRIVIGVILAIAGIAAVGGFWDVGAVIGVVALVVGAILLVTGSTQKCPINDMAGIDTTE